MTKSAHLFQFSPDVVRKAEAFNTNGLDSNDVTFVSARARIETLHAQVTDWRIIFAWQFVIFTIAIILVWSVTATQKRAPTDEMIGCVTEIGCSCGNYEFTIVHLPEEAG